MHRILQVGLGALGREVARDLFLRRLGTVVAAVDVDPALAGRPLRELVPEAGSDARVESDLERALSGTEVDCAIVMTSSWLLECAPIFRALLERGLAVVSTCEELVHPELHHEKLAASLHALALDTGGRLLGTGVNPGFLMDALPLLCSAVCRDVRSIEVLRRQDAGRRRLPFQQKIGIGLGEEEFDDRVRDGRFGHAGLEESLHFLARHLGLVLQAGALEVEPLFGDRELASGLGQIPAGRVRGIRQVARGEAACGRRIELEFVAALGVDDPLDRVRIAGDPPLEVRIPGGVHGDTATVAITVNAIPSLLAAPPGLHTMASIPPVRWLAGAPGAVPGR